MVHDPPPGWRLSLLSCSSAGVAGCHPAPDTIVTILSDFLIARLHHGLCCSPARLSSLHTRPVGKRQADFGVMRPDVIHHGSTALHSASDGDPGTDFTSAAAQGIRIKCEEMLYGLTVIAL